MYKCGRPRTVMLFMLWHMTWISCPDKIQPFKLVFEKISLILHHFTCLTIILRPCKRQNFPNFGLSRNSKRALFQNFPKLQKYCVKIVFFEARKYSKMYVFDLWTSILRSKTYILRSIMYVLLVLCFAKQNAVIIVWKSNYLFYKKIVPTRIPTRIFEIEFGMQGPI